MEEEKNLKKVLKWAGIAALIAVPVIVLLKKKRNQHPDYDREDDSNIFASELDE